MRSSSNRITREDLEAAFSSLGSRTTNKGKGDSRSLPQGIVLALAGGALTMAVAYFFGKRKGKKRSITVEFERE